MAIELLRRSPGSGLGQFTATRANSAYEALWRPETFRCTASNTSLQSLSFALQHTVSQVMPVGQRRLTIVLPSLSLQAGDEIAGMPRQLTIKLPNVCDPPVGNLQMMCMAVPICSPLLSMASCMMQLPGTVRILHMDTCLLTQFV